MKPLRNAFTLLEIVFVIVILGVVSSIGAQIIARVYENYLVERTLYYANIKTELTLQQIANRLRHAIPGTVGYRANTTSPFSLITIAPSPTNQVLQWVGSDAESFHARTATDLRPGWSGFIDLDPTVTAPPILKTPGSNLSIADTIIDHLSHGTKNLSNAYLYFPDSSYYPITGFTPPDQLNVPIGSGNPIYERYKLAWSSYALSVENGDLYLYSNFSPMVGTSIPSSATKNLLLKGVSNFRFKGSEGSLRIKLCVNNTLRDTNVTSCKEQVVF